MSSSHCRVPGCTERGGEDKILHHFPNPEWTKERFNAWVFAVGGRIIPDDNDYIFKYRHVCRRHFETKFQCRNHKITRNVIPTLHLPDVQKLQPVTETHMLTASAIELANKEEPQETQGLKPRTKVKKNKHLYLYNHEGELRRKIISIKVALSKCKNKIKKQKAEISAAKKIAMNPNMSKTIENCSTFAKLLMEVQWRENKKRAQGRRFTVQEKVMALSILKQSPKCYRFLRKNFVLPAPQTLIKLIQKSNLHPGINRNIFLQLKKKTESMKVEEKLCVLIFDEISLKANITYCEKKNKVTGFIDDGQQCKPEFANHALVFVIRGLIHNYKQAVAYTFASNATRRPELAKQIKIVISHLQEAGLIVVASICDQSTNNRQAIQLLLDETRGICLRNGEVPIEKTLIINNQEVIPMYDSPHLLKGIRNNLMTKNLKYTYNGQTRIAKWSHLQLLHKENPVFEGIRLIPKLTDQHVNPEKVNKMKVKFASQIFIRTVGANIGYLADKEILPTECKDTASLLLFMDNIFDSMNGSYKKMAMQNHC